MDRELEKELRARAEQRGQAHDQQPLSLPGMGVRAVTGAALSLQGRRVVLRTLSGSEHRGKLDGLLTHPTLVLDGEPFALSTVESLRPEEAA